MSDDLKFSVVSSLFSWMHRSKSAKLKRSKFRKFLDNYCKPGDYYSAIRLILPSLDRERGSYGFKEFALANCLIDALGMSRDSPDAVRLINWRKGGAKTGANAGNFPNVAAEVLQRRQGMASGGLTVKELNDLLDHLASGDREKKISILGDLIRKTNSQEMKWIIMIILKDLKLGVSEKSIFHEFHPDAEDLFNVTCDLRLVCEKLCDKNQRHIRQDIDVGKPVRPQLAMRVDSAAAAWKKLHGKEVVVECKFDGHRIQVHKNGSDIHFFTRNFNDRDTFKDAMSSIVTKNILVDSDLRCILDGELVVWEKSTNRFVEFAAHQEEAKAAGDGLESDHQFCYVAFDILYYGDTSVIHRSLKERHELLQKVVKPLKYRFEILVPDGGLNANQPSGEPRWSLVAHTLSDVERSFKETIDNRDEGIVLKDLGSKWDPCDRSGKWLKLKPDYIHAGSDLDVLIIGGYYGSGRHGGEVAQFLVGLAEKSAPNTYPRRFISFCRVGTGLSDDELKELVSKLKPYFRKYEYPKKAAPSFYHVTNNSRERPDVWIENPEKSVILSITSDIRTTSSEVFATPHSLRFPRIDKVRYDKPWHECLDVQSFVELVLSSNGTTQRTGNNEGLQDEKPKRPKPSKRGDKNKISLVPSHFIQTDVSTVKGETSIFSDMVVYFVNVPPNYSLDLLHKMVIENGGTFSMNLSNAVTHCIASESKGIKYEAAKRHGDVIHYSWFLECCSQNKLIRLQPKYFLFLSDSLRKKLRDEIDEYSDSYFWDLNVHELKQILGSVKESEDVGKIDHYKKKYCPSNKWSRFHGCCMYFHNIVAFHSEDWRDLLGLSARRMKAEVSVGGGTVSENLSQATHLVVLLAPGYGADSQGLLESFSLQEKRILYKKKLLIVRSQWLEDRLNENHRLPEAPYSLKPDVLGETGIGNDQDETETDVSASPVHEEKPPSPVPAMKDQQALAPIRGLGRKRGRPQAASVSTRTKKGGINQPRRTRPRVAHRPAKICADESETTVCDDKTGDEVDTESLRDPMFHASTFVEEKPTEIKEVDMVEDLDFSGNNKGHEADEQAATADDSRGQSRREDSVDSGGCSKPNTQKLGATINPLEAMLLDIIPGLRMKQADTSSSVKREEKAPAVTKSEPLAEPNLNPEIDLAPVKEKGPMDTRAEPPVGPNPGPAKKKKVSYKDMASELLKDW